MAMTPWMGKHVLRMGGTSQRRFVLGRVMA